MSPDALFRPLLALHIAAGTTALLSALVAIAGKTLNLSHRSHVISGITYTLCMALIFVTAIGMSFIHANLFLLLIAIFSFYQAVSGWRYAKNRTGIPTAIDWAAPTTMLATGLGMIGVGAFNLLSNGDSNGVTLIAFGAIGLASSLDDIRQLHGQKAVGKLRIALHLSRMLGGTIATITAVLVVNARSFQPAFIMWLLPTVVIVPVLVWSRRRVMLGAKRA